MFEHFTVVPSIDLKGGQVVRLLRGDMSRVTVYSTDPQAVARGFEGQGAELIHIVDLDGAMAGAPRNLGAIAAIRDAVRCALDVSGGLRSIEDVRRAFAAGADRISIGSAAFLEPELIKRACAEFPGRVFGSLDVRGGLLAIRGWVETSQLTITEAAERFRTAGVAAAIVTDISRDGAQAGVDSAQMAEMAKAVRLPIIASGGVSTLDDVVALSGRFADGVVGVVVGRALYEKSFGLAEAIAATRNRSMSQ
ncbi:MAG TPA: HisA/HisF-related TIM barrel protein [Candidatus Acidoferrales bacterium]|nr:HisA/HisF-related TIM barrel protein [Candidatus Acidoferrales bacterium]